MKVLLIILLLLIALVLAFFFFQGRKSTDVTGPEILNDRLPECGAKPNCVCSQQKETDSHYIEPIKTRGANMDSVRDAIGKLGGVVVSGNDTQLHATFVSSIFKFTDDLLLLIEEDTLHVRSSSRVGHSDLGANRKRVEQLREMI